MGFGHVERNFASVISTGTPISSLRELERRRHPIELQLRQLIFHHLATQRGEELANLGRAVVRPTPNDLLIEPRLRQLEGAYFRLLNNDVRATADIARFRVDAQAEVYALYWDDGARENQGNENAENAMIEENQL